MLLRIAGLVNDSIVDGPGFRLTVFTQGCPHHCDGCHNPHTHSFTDGRLIETEEIIEKVLDNLMLDGVTFSGGEPFCQAEPLYHLGNILREKGYNIMTYTGYTFEYLVENSNDKNFYKELLSVTDYLVDGKFEKDKKSHLLRFAGSTNQRIIDCAKSFAEGKVVLAEL